MSKSEAVRIGKLCKNELELAEMKGGFRDLPELFISQGIGRS